MKTLKRFSIILIPVLAILFSCQKENVINNKDITLEFSTDTIMFDTVFTEIGSTTKRFTVKNPENGTITIDEIKLAGGDNSIFRLNVNGIVANTVEDMEIRGKDSIFIFVEVSTDSTHENLPMVREDSILFRVHDSEQQVKVIAFGQDYILKKREFLTTQTWTAELPYLIFDYIVVDSLQTLTIEEGCQLHFHHQASLYVLGTLIVKGSVNNPVVFQGDRLEYMYDDVPGQWGYIHLVSGSHDNEIDYAVIKNAIIGIQVDTFFNTAPTLVISNTKIENMNAVGLYAQGAKIQASNCVFSNCGQYSAALAIGGDYQFYHCTFGNYWSYSNRVTPSVIINNYYEDVNENIHIRPIENAYFANCIIYGNRENEIGLDMYKFSSQEMFNYRFENCLLKTDTVLPDNRQINCLVNEDPNFLNPFNGNLELDTLSAAKNVADYTTATFYPYDIKGNSRLADGGADIGAYERIEER
ncbi:MAG: hypothetical protein K9H64_03015 [Bacteroidales bacterium]|nr:hypothetical protein [Bacteroidales bacterium]MCF8454487.1 hypothetical protein [Bacteroidales bacterium]